MPLRSLDNKQAWEDSGSTRLNTEDTEKIGEHGGVCAVFVNSAPSSCPLCRVRRPDQGGATKDLGDSRPGAEGGYRTPRIPIPRQARLGCVLQNEKTCRGIRDGDVIAAVNFRHSIVQDAAHRQPENEFRSLRARLANEFVDGHAREDFGLVDDFVEAELVEFLVDEAGALAIELMGHAAGAQHDDL